MGDASFKIVYSGLSGEGDLVDLFGIGAKGGRTSILFGIGNTITLFLG